MRDDIEEALAAWRDAARRRDNAIDGDRALMQADVERYRSDFQRCATEHMVERIGALKEAESRRQAATPSTPSFHQAARDEKAIAAEIWDTARISDEDTPQH
jgi:hypothetical protein